MLKLEDVSLTRGGRSILRSIGFELARGEIRLLIGPSGAGKTSILRLVAGLEPADRGRIWIGGALATNARRMLLPPHQRGIRMVFQDGALWDHMTVEQHLRFGLRPPAGGRGHRDLRVEETLAWLGLWERRRERPGHLSGGERQRLGLARALVARPRMLLLDEPLAHVDLPSQRRLGAEIVRIARQEEITALWITHRPGEVEVPGGSVSLVEDGRIVQHIEAGEVEAWLRAMGT